MNMHLPSLLLLLAAPAAAEVVSAVRERLRSPRDRRSWSLPPDAGLRGLRAASAPGGTPSTPTAAIRANLSLELVPGGCFCERIRRRAAASSICGSLTSSRASASS